MTLAERVYLDKQHRSAFLALSALAKEAKTAALNAGLDEVLVELVNMRVSQLNGCAYCLDVHHRTALRVGVTEQRLAVLPAWRDTALFDERERAALALAESITLLPEPAVQDREYAFAASVLSEEQLSAVSWVTIAIGSMNRMSIASRHPVRPR
ncbi:carboxymuconolactone decarboxylase family protein [Ruicaihuangia caeni]|uniref:Carboxymuconolactone decarboxylase family protein n=1 Tax=Ruicaihuangia caeni TaxID=3042517 RepID=A0AAW6T504_9MICO|nr:carboxymuconolactone decarboxylase family protein [Klugiella sp. YN-L-19]MDI2098176.1 carboxymuconolactone decarboxylase family protein [Klugiella sp. YN-L-19]